MEIQLTLTVEEVNGILQTLGQLPTNGPTLTPVRKNLLKPTKHKLQRCNVKI